MAIMDDELFPRGGKALSHKKERGPKKRKTESLFKVLSLHPKLYPRLKNMITISPLETLLDGNTF